MKTKFSRLVYIVSMMVFFHISCCLCYGQDSIRLYPGISLRQHDLSQHAMHQFFNQHWDSAEATCIEMRTLEQDKGLIPMSFLFRFAMRAWRILNNECENDSVYSELHRELDPLRTECIRILHAKANKFPDSTLATRLFLEGGINGFNSTLKIRSNPFAAMISGLSSVRLLDSARALAPYMTDVYFGLGISQCALANEPGIIRVAMRIFRGLHVNLETGLSYLRICSQKGLYTNDGAREYLIQFLSPFKPSEAAEKQQIFRSFQALFPGNPYFVFQEIDEGLAFHRREVFSYKTIEWAKPLIQSFDTCNYSRRRYANLVRCQCAVIDFSLTNELHPEPLGTGEAFSFYPSFLGAATERNLLDSAKDLSRKQRKNGLRRYQTLKDKAISMLYSADINPMLREYYLYHIQDGMQ
jgi:hypothetical protein